MLLCLTPNPLTFKSTFVELGVYRVNAEHTSLKNSFLKFSFSHSFRVDYSIESHFSEVQKAQFSLLALTATDLLLNGGLTPVNNHV